MILTTNHGPATNSNQTDTILTLFPIDKLYNMWYTVHMMSTVEGRELMKDSQRVFRLPRAMSNAVDQAAEARGMNFSEFMRYVLTSFFDGHMDSKPHLVNTLVPQRSPIVTRETARRRPNGTLRSRTQLPASIRWRCADADHNPITNGSHGAFFGKRREPRQG